MISNLRRREKVFYEAYCSTSITYSTMYVGLIAFNCDHFIGKNFEVPGVRNSCLKMSSKGKISRQSLKENGYMYFQNRSQCSKLMQQYLKCRQVYQIVKWANSRQRAMSHQYWRLQSSWVITQLYIQIKYWFINLHSMKMCNVGKPTKSLIISDW